MAFHRYVGTRLCGPFFFAFATAALDFLTCFCLSLEASYVTGVVSFLFYIHLKPCMAPSYSGKRPKLQQ